MIWFLLNVWWLLGAGVALIGLVILLTGVWPAALALLRRMPDRLLAAIIAAFVTVVAVSLASGWLVGIGEERCRAEQEAGEKRADERAAPVIKKAADKADVAKDRIKKESADVQVQIREVVRTVPATCPPMPDELHDILQREVEETRARVQKAAAGRSG